mmetsp:Transcript_14018/g.34700  ORF Transcript_14018/g.34700 Transcript_14018/m.34700 type:complete len:218 (+) Transcript_14018:882-1535(+)
MNCCWPPGSWRVVRRVFEVGVAGRDRPMPGDVIVRQQVRVAGEMAGVVGVFGVAGNGLFLIPAEQSIVRVRNSWRKVFDGRRLFVVVTVVVAVGAEVATQRLRIRGKEHQLFREHFHSVFQPCFPFQQVLFPFLLRQRLDADRKFLHLFPQASQLLGKPLHRRQTLILLHQPVSFWHFDFFCVCFLFCFFVLFRLFEFLQVLGNAARRMHLLLPPDR